jgi:hypothetical protein
MLFSGSRLVALAAFPLLAAGFNDGEIIKVFASHVGPVNNRECSPVRGTVSLTFLCARAQCRVVERPCSHRRPAVDCVGIAMHDDSFVPLKGPRWDYPCLTTLTLSLPRSSLSSCSLRDVQLLRYAVLCSQGERWKLARPRGVAHGCVLARARRAHFADCARVPSLAAGDRKVTTAYELKYNVEEDFKELCVKTFTPEEGEKHACEAPRAAPRGPLTSPSPRSRAPVPRNRGGLVRGDVR